MLADRGLYFPIAASFKDTLEGSATEQYVRRRREEVDREFLAAKPFYEARIKEFQNPAGRRFNERTAEEYAEAQVALVVASREQWIRDLGQERALRQWRSVYESAIDSLKWWREHVYVSCWYSGNEESAQMWAHTDAPHTAVCVLSNVEKLRGTLPAAEFKIVNVKYVDREAVALPGPCDSGLLNAEDLYRYKDVKYEHEHEVRAFHQKVFFVPGPHGSVPLRSPGLLVPMDLNKLVTEVRVCPDAAAWYADFIAEMCIRAGLRCPVSRSELTGRGELPAIRA